MKILFPPPFDLYAFLWHHVIVVTVKNNSQGRGLVCKYRNLYNGIVAQLYVTLSNTIVSFE